MATKFRSNYDFTYPFSDTGAKCWLAANTELQFTIPGTPDQKYRAHFRYQSNAEIWVKVNGTIVVPVVGVASTSYNEEFLPINLYVVGGDVLHFISTGTPQLGISLLSLPD